MPINVTPNPVRGSVVSRETSPITQPGAAIQNVPSREWTPGAGAPRPRVRETAPITQTDMNLAAGEKRAASEARLNGLESATRNRLSPTSVTNGRGLATREQDAFQAYASAASEFVASSVRGGSLEPHMKATSLTNLMDQRSAMLEATGQEGVMSFGSTAGTGLTTQGDMNQDAAFTLKAAKEELASVSQRIALRLGDGPRAVLFGESNARFEDYVSAAANRAGAKVAGGSMEPLARAGIAEHLVRERTALLKQDLARMDL